MLDLRRVAAAIGVAFTTVLALTVSGSSESNTEIIEVGEVTGTHGSESGGSNQGSVQSRIYGFHCSGKTCLGADDPPALQNKLTITLTRSASETGEITVVATTSLGGKQAKTETRDWDCPQGPPLWDATASVKISAPSVSGSFSDIAGSLEEHFLHSVSPTTAWHKKSTQTPVPGGSGGTTYARESSDLVFWQWQFDPDNPSTNTLVVKAEVTTDFIGSGKEINVVECWMKAQGQLAANKL